VATATNPNLKGPAGAARGAIGKAEIITHWPGSELEIDLESWRRCSSSIVKMGGDGSMQDLAKINENLVQRTAHLANELNNAFAIRRKLEVNVFSAI
jgi:hypothetical protein